MDTRETALQRLRNFLEDAKKNPLWVVAFGLFAYACFFVARFYIEFPSRYSTFQRNAIEFERYHSDGDRVVILYDSLKAAYSAAQEVSKHYGDTLAGRKPGELVETKKLIGGIEIATRARLVLSKVTGTLQGIQFYDARLSGLAKGFEADLQNAENLVKAIEGAYRAQVFGNRTDASRFADQLRGWKERSEEFRSAALTRVQMFGEQARLMESENTVKISEETAKLGQFNLEFYLLIPALAYIAGFVFLGVRSWSRHGEPASKGTKDIQRKQKRK